MKQIDIQLARRLIDFCGSASHRSDSSRSPITASFAESQLRGSVASYNMLVANRVAYIADEVGLGKTYVALGVMGLFRHFQPDSRMLVIAPRENIQRKWVKELGNFVRNNWLVTDNRVKSLQGTPVRPPTVCNSLADFAHELANNADQDFFLRMTSCSLALKRWKSRKRLHKKLCDSFGWLSRPNLERHTPEEFREIYGEDLHKVLPPIDLLVVDEAHNLRKGFGSKAERNVSNRNRILGLALGHPSVMSDEKPRVRHVLCLSATPFEEDYGDIWRQLDVLSVGNAEVGTQGRQRVFSVRDLAEASTDEEAKQTLTKNLLIRRISHLEIGKKKHTKNMYRREWRQGGFIQVDEPMNFDDPQQRLVVALVQKKVAEVLGNEQFNNQFQIGMLSSFESFSETISRRQAKRVSGEATENVAPHFDGRQTRNEDERRGADTSVLNTVSHSFRENFGTEMPHPKLDATVEFLSKSFRTGEKALVFVRRVATVSDLAQRLDREFDRWVREKMKLALPNLENEIDQLFNRFKREIWSQTDPKKIDVVSSDSSDDYGDLSSALQDDQGGRENFFTWYYRGKGPEGILSGGAFQRNRLSATRAVHSTLFEDDLVSWILGRPEHPLACLAEQLRMSSSVLEQRLRELAWTYFRLRSTQEKGYPRLYVFEAYQAAALYLLTESKTGLASKACDVLSERFPDHTGDRGTPKLGFPASESAIGITTFFTELVQHSDLRTELWPDDVGDQATFAVRFRRREQRRVLLSAMSRLGCAYIDLYLVAIKEHGSFEFGRTHREGFVQSNLARNFVKLLEQQRSQPGLHAFAELRGAAEAFDTLVAVNFPKLPYSKVSELPTIFGHTLQHQNPVGRMSGRVAGRVVEQFRMPGFPLVLISTDVLQEGEDLHTFCRKVIHYGITWTPSGMEQRTGRVDRINSLLHRQLDGRKQEPTPEERIQVHYPHLQDTVERIQVKRVLHRMDHFIRLTHQFRKPKEHDRRINKNREILTSTDLPTPVEGLLKSAFPVREEWLQGNADPRSVQEIDVDGLEVVLRSYWNELVKVLDIEQIGGSQPHLLEGKVPMQSAQCDDFAETSLWRSLARDEGHRRLVRVVLRSAGVDGVCFVQCSSEIGLFDLQQRRIVQSLQRLQRQLHQPRICARYDERHRKYSMSVEACLPFDKSTLQYEEFEDLVRRVSLQADCLEHGEDARDRTVSSEAGRASALKLRARLKGLGPKYDIEEGLPETDIVVSMKDNERRQRIRILRDGRQYIFVTLVHEAIGRQWSPQEQQRMAVRAWERNALTELVNFTLDERGRLVGEIRHLADHLDAEELELYLRVLATEGDRFEYVLTGRDRF